jgi:RNA polymerase sigma-70 factor (ECF subfamily)
VHLATPIATKSAGLLRFREGLGFDEMAGLSDEKPGTLQARVARALPVLRKCLERRLRDAEAA